MLPRVMRRLQLRSEPECRRRMPLFPIEFTDRYGLGGVQRSFPWLAESDPNLSHNEPDFDPSAKLSRIV